MHTIRLHHDHFTGHTLQVCRITRYDIQRDLRVYTTSYAYSLGLPAYAAGIILTVAIDRKRIDIVKLTLAHGVVVCGWMCIYCKYHSAFMVYARRDINDLLIAAGLQGSCDLCLF